MAPHGRSPVLPEGSGMPGVATGETGETATPPLLPCRSHAPASCALHSAARPSEHRLIVPCDIDVLPFTSQIKHRTGPPSLDQTLKPEVTFCVQGVVSPLLSNILLTPFDKEMRQMGYRLTRWADDWVVTCRTRAEAESALVRATKILGELGVTLNREKTRIVHISKGFEFLGFKIQQGRNRLKLPRDRIKSRLNRQNLYAIPTQKSLDRFKDQIRALTKRQVPLRLGELVETINPVIRGWGNYYCRSHVRKCFHQLDGWIIRRLWSHRLKRWRNAGWRKYPTKRLREEFKLISLVSLIPSLQIARAHS